VNDDRQIIGLSRTSAQAITDAAIKWISGHRDEPFFLWTIYFDPHDPYMAPEGFRGYYNKTNPGGFSGNRRALGINVEGTHNYKVTPQYREFLINAYDEEIRYFDHEFGWLIDYLKTEGLYDNTMIIFTADHGEELGDNGNRWDHCQLLSQEEIWVPLMVKMPGRRRKGERYDPVQIIDVYPTVVEFLDGDDTPDEFSRLEGVSFLRELDPRAPADSERYAVSFWEGQGSVVMGDYKYWIRDDGSESLVDLRTGEKVDDPAIRDRLKARLDDIKKKCKEKYWDRIITDLKALGYM